MLELMTTIFEATIGRNDTWPLAMVIAGIMVFSFWFGLQMLKHEEAIDYGLAVSWHVTKIIMWHLGFTALTIIRGFAKMIKALSNAKQTVTQFRQTGDANFADD